MNKKILSLLIFIISFNGYGQYEWASIGAKWFYTERYANSGDIAYIKIESVKDTVIQGKSCKKLITNSVQRCSNRTNIEYMYSDSAKVFFFDAYLNNFQMLYDFSREKGDSWKIILNSDNYLDTLVITVDSVADLEVNQQILKKLYVTYSSKTYVFSPLKQESEIIEFIGDINYMFPWNGSACDANYASGLRCYEDEIIGFFSRDISPSCEYILTGISNVYNNDIMMEVFPTYVHSIIKVLVKDNININYNILNINGKICINGNVNDHEINIQHLNSGIYFIKFYDVNNNLVYVKKIVKI